MFDIKNITRKNIQELNPYSSAREEFSGEATIWLDANENPYDTDFNRYPDPSQSALKKVISNIKKVKPEQIFIGNGSDEAIDLLFRAFCEPQVDKAYLFPPTYGMYEVSANINNVEIERIPLNENFEIPEIEKIKTKIKSKGLLFICSPNNPTGNVHSLIKIKEIADFFPGLVIVDEAYIDFADAESALSLLDSKANLVVLQTMSKAYGLAGLRVGMAFASAEIIKVLNKIKPPYNVNTFSQRKTLALLENRSPVEKQITQIKEQRKILINSLKKSKAVIKIYPTETNFILAEFKNADVIYTTLQNKGIIIRNRTKEIKNGLRITVGSPEQNEILIKTLQEITL